MRSARTLLPLMSLILWMVCSGCQSGVTLHPLTSGDPNSIDIVRIPAGSTFMAPSSKSGWWMSEEYLREVMRARIK
jgi:hypothetical protein